MERDVRTKIIYNPSANHGQASEFQEQIDALSRRYPEVDLVTTDRPGHASVLARDAVEAGYELVVAAGGDGTIHEIVNGLVIGDTAQATMGVLPMGSGNDFVYGMGFSTDLEIAIQKIFNGKRQFNDLARIDDEHGRSEIVCNGIGIGFDATVSIQSRLITRVHGFAMYALAALRTIALYYQTPHLIIHFDDKIVEQDTLLLAVGLGPRIGGGFFLTPDAIFDDNLLDSCTVNPVGRVTMLAMLPRVMRGTHITSHHVTMRRSKTLDIKSSLPLPIHIDGEIFAYPEDDVRHVTITILPQALPIISSKPGKTE